MEQIVAQLVEAHNSISGILKCKQHTAISVAAVESMIEGMASLLEDGEVKEELLLLAIELKQAFDKKFQTTHKPSLN